MSFISTSLSLDSSIQMKPILSIQIWTEKVVGEYTRVEFMLSKRCKKTPVKLRRDWIITSSRYT